MVTQGRAAQRRKVVKQFYRKQPRMELDLKAVVGLTGASTALVALVLGYLSERSMLAAVMLALATALACVACLAGTILWGRAGLMISVVLVSLLGAGVGRGIGGRRGALFVPLLWLGFFTCCAIGYAAGRELGLLTITLPSLLVFWAALFGVSRAILPQPQARWTKAFRCLLSFCLGTNRPYSVLEGSELVQRVPGNPYGQFFAGPGIVLTDPAHAPVIWDGLKFKRIGEPGLTLTDRMETVYQTVDLRPQFRSCLVEAICRDGIRVRVQTSVAFRLQATGHGPEIGGSFPHDDEAIFRAVWRQPIEEGQARSWDEVVLMVATRLLRRIIGQYRIDALCEPFDPDSDPRSEIRDQLLRQLRRQLRPAGVDIVDAWLGNLEPVDSIIIEQRTKSWRAEWERRILITEGQARANAIAEVERAYVQAQAELIAAITQVVEHQPEMNPEVLSNMAALHFVENLWEMTSNPAVQQAVPTSTAEVIDYLHRAVRSDVS